jgi:hypothetical protein
VTAQDRELENGGVLLNAKLAAELLSALQPTESVKVARLRYALNQQKEKNADLERQVNRLWKLGDEVRAAQARTTAEKGIRDYFEKRLIELGDIAFVRKILGKESQWAPPIPPEPKPETPAPVAVFDMDGDEHQDDFSGCECNSRKRPCPKCDAPMHIQSLYDGIWYLCRACGHEP